MINYSELLICRVCECENNNLLNIYQISNIHIFNNLQELTCKLIEDEEINKLPKFICIECNSKLNNALEFKKQCLNTENKIKVKIENQLEELKYEIEFLEEEHVEDEKTNKSDDHDSISIDDVFEDQFENKPEPRQRKYELKKEGIPKIIQCPRCKKLFNNLEESLLHHKNKCKELYHCEECPTMFASKYLFDRHIKQVHPVENPLECKICSKIFKTKPSLKCHKNYVHLKERKHFCDICKKGFIDITGLRYHIESHRPKGEERLHKRVYRKYVYKKEECSRVCETCGLQFSTYATYYQHVRIKHSENFKKQIKRVPPKIIKCNLCQYTCRSNGQLAQHTRVHTNERPFKCTICSAAFKLSPHLKNHIKSVHLGEEI